MSVDLKNHLQAIAANIEAAGRDVLGARQSLRNMADALDQLPVGEIREQNDKLKAVTAVLQDAYNQASEVAVQLRKLSG